MTLRCPNCKCPVVRRTADPSRPFCSERCKLIDLGRWLDEVYVVPGEHVDDDRVNRPLD